MRDFEFATKISELPREGYILSRDKLYQVDGDYIIKVFDMPGVNIDENISFLRDSSGVLGTIPSCCVSDDAVIYVDCHNLFNLDSYYEFIPTWIYDSRCHIAKAICAAVIGGIVVGVVAYKLLKK